MKISPTDILQSYEASLEGIVRSVSYKALFFNTSQNHSNHCILVLPGTSIQIADIERFIELLLEKRFAVSAIERRIGYPFDWKIDPKLERKVALMHFLKCLQEKCGIEKIDIIGHSYASFEIVRVLMEAPEIFKSHVHRVFLVNPAGFDPCIKYIRHCLRFLFIFIPSEYRRCLSNMLRYGFLNYGRPHHDMRKLRNLSAFFLKTLWNPLRTSKEIADIVSFDIIPLVKVLADIYGFVFYFVLNMEDNLVNASKTLAFAHGLVPDENILTLPGNHLDSIVDDRQILSIIDLLDTMNQKGLHA